MRVWDDGDLLHQPHFPSEFIDCITQEVMQDPVITADGHTYERSAILRWLQFCHSPFPVYSFLFMWQMVHFGTLSSVQPKSWGML
jgi:hypothetical protein